MRLNKKTLMIAIGVLVAIVAIVGIRSVLGSKKSDEQMAREATVVQIAVRGWQVKHIARLDVNKDKIREFKQGLMNFYDAESGALIEQQRLLDTLIATDYAADDLKKQKILNFKLTGLSFEKINAGENEANLRAKLEYYVEYFTEAQYYKTFGKGTYEWKLKNIKDKWKIVEEKLVPGDKE